MESDGTLEGTTITVNGKEVEGLTSFYFNYHKPEGDEELYYDPISCNYTVSSDSEDGFESITYSLNKAEEKLKMDYAKLGAFVKALTGTEIAEEQFKKMDQAKQDELHVLSQYAVQMPQDLSKAIGHFLKSALAVPDDKPADKPDDKPADKPADADDEPDDMKELIALKDRLEALIAGKKPNPEDVNKAILAKMQEVSERIATLEKGEKPKVEPVEKKDDLSAADSESNEILDLLKGINARLSVVEKSSGIEKGASEAGGGDGDEVDLYKSINL